MKFSPFIAALLFVFAISSCKKDHDATPVAGKNKIVYIYKTDGTDAQSFKSLLESNNCTVTLLEKSAITGFDFSSSSLIVVASNTDAIQVTPAWSDNEATAINGSGKPVLLVGIGGLQLAKKLNNAIHYGNCASATLTSFTVTDATDNIYKSPKAINVANGQPLTIFSSASLVEGFHASSLPVSNVILFGNTTAGSAYYPVAMENNRYGVFGFTGDIISMTPAGKDFMVNMVYRVGKLSL